MQAIPTEYRGTMFRSRLEASYAAHFDALGMPWAYEPEAFTLSDGTNYLPDFWLPSAKAWAEVKGPHGERVKKLEQFSADLWAESGARDTYDTRAPMALLFGPPIPPDDAFDYWRVSPGLNVIGGIAARIPGAPVRAGFGSTAFARCRLCRATTIVALWQPWCRHCGGVYEEPLDWIDDCCRTDHPPIPFVNLSSDWHPPRR
jgi:hypothetical protein